MSKWSQQYDVKLQEQKERPRRPLPHDNTRPLLRHPFLVSSGRVLLPRSQEVARCGQGGGARSSGSGGGLEGWQTLRHHWALSCHAPLFSYQSCLCCFRWACISLDSLPSQVSGTALALVSGRWDIFKNLLGISGTVLLFCLRCWPLVLCPFF